MFQTTPNAKFYLLTGGNHPLDPPSHPISKITVKGIWINNFISLGKYSVTAGRKLWKLLLKKGNITFTVTLLESLIGAKPPCVGYQHGVTFSFKHFHPHIIVKGHLFCHLCIKWMLKLYFLTCGVILHIYLKFHNKKSGMCKE